MKVFLIRHGETTGDIEDRYGGAYDDDLTALGQQQLKATADRLSGQKVDKIYVSPLKRACQSAAIINEVLHTEIEIVTGLQERNYGLLGGLTKSEALAKYPEAVEAHKNPDNTDPEGEPRFDFIERVVNAFEKIQVVKYDTIIILAHGGSLKVILKHLHQPIPSSIGDGEIIEVTV